MTVEISIRTKVFDFRNLLRSNKTRQFEKVYLFFVQVGKFKKLLISFYTYVKLANYYNLNK